jgi:pyridoxal phosphate enzyme (YggS family)
MINRAALRARLADVRDRIARAADRAGRDPASICLVAVSKTFPLDDIRAAAEAGQVDFGENRVQEALQKMDQARDLPLRWHLVGHVQTNKAKRAGARFDVVHSVDAPQLAARLDEGAREAGRSLDVLVQVDLAGEATKHGVRPSDLPAVLASVGRAPSLRMRGLMLLPPFGPSAEASRPYFAALRRLRDELVEAGRSGGLPDLSMGMSHDFEVAIEEGATIVRVGSAIFGERMHG